jgi:hypothetical protein
VSIRVPPEFGSTIEVSLRTGEVMGMVAVHSPTPPVRGPGRLRVARSPSWLAGYRQRSVTTDVLIVVLAVLAAHTVRVNSDFSVVATAPTLSGEWPFAVALIVAWLISLATEAVWDGHVLGTGGTEYRRILVASLVPFAVVGIVGYLTLADLARGYLLVALPLGAVGLLVGHWAWRRRLIVDGG